MKQRLLIPAAGMGRRLGKDLPKALVPLRGEPMLLVTLRRFLFLPINEPVIIIFPPGYEMVFKEMLTSFPVPVALVEGGGERQDSVQRGLRLVGKESGIVIIHDAARPFVSQQEISSVIRGAEQYDAATLAIPTTDTILEEDGLSFLQHTPDRSRLWCCQTPQVFKTQVICGAYNWAEENKVICTDDATLVHKSGHVVQLVRGKASNFKITTSDDLMYADFLLEGGWI